jgi:hypothetical protein
MQRRSLIIRSGHRRKRQEERYGEGVIFPCPDLLPRYVATGERDGASDSHRARPAKGEEHCHGPGVPPGRVLADLAITGARRDRPSTMTAISELVGITSKLVIVLAHEPHW